MAKNQGYQDLQVWHKAIDLVQLVYDHISKFPRDEKYDLVLQIRRAVVSVPSNIAEGCARNSYGEFIQFLGIATGSLAELHTQMIIALRLNYIGKIEFQDLETKIDEVRRMINGLKSSIKTQKSTLAVIDS